MKERVCTGICELQPVLLIGFGVVLAGGVTALVPSLVERLSVSRTESSSAPTCASTQAGSKGKDCIVRHDLPVGTDVQPVQPAQVEASSQIDNPPELTLPQQHAAALPDQPIETPEIVAPVHSEGASATVRPPEVVAPVHETMPPPAHAEERARAKPTPNKVTAVPCEQNDSSGSDGGAAHAQGFGGDAAV
jgi:hypothetical protein